MKQTFTAVDHPILPKRLRVDDPRIPDVVRAQLAHAARPIMSVGPVPGIDRIEWLLFDANNALVESVFAGTRTDGSH